MPNQKGPWSPCGLRVAPGEKKQAMICPNVAGYTMPVTAVAGAKPGRTLLITAGTHSGEYPGLPAAIRLGREADPAAMSGNLLIVHCVNTSGFKARTNSIVPEDGGNLNRDFPGRPDGGCTERIADYFVREIFPHVDFVADLHSGSMNESLTPCLFFPCGDAVREQELAAARAMDIPYLVRSTNGRGIPGWAALSMGIPSLLLERGDLGLTEAACCEAYYRDMRLLMNHLGILPFADIAVCEKSVFEDAVYLTSDAEGLWYPAVRKNQIVRTGDPLGHVEDFFGNPIIRYRAPKDGVVLYLTISLSVNAGTPLVAFGVTP